VCTSVGGVIVGMHCCSRPLADSLRIGSAPRNNCLAQDDGIPQCRQEWSRVRESNSRQSLYKSDALPTELTRPWPSRRATTILRWAAASEPRADSNQRRSEPALPVTSCREQVADSALSYASGRQFNPDRVLHPIESAQLTFVSRSVRRRLGKLFHDRPAEGRQVIR
jgi:hypothetical protein